MTSCFGKSATLAALLSATLAVGSVFAQEVNGDDRSPITATIAGYSAGGMASFFGEGQALTVRNVYAGSNIVYEAGNPAGSMVAVATGAREFALETSIEIGMALRGEEPFPESYEGRLFAVTAVGPGMTRAHIYGRKAFFDQYGITTLHDVREKRVPVRLSANRPGNLWNRAHVVSILAQYGLTMAMIEEFGGEIIAENVGGTNNLMRDGRADMMITGGLIPIGAFIELNTVVPLAFLPMTLEEAQGAADDMNIEVGLIPAGTYDFHEGEMVTPMTTHFIIGGPSTTNEQAYKFARAMYEDIETYQNAHPALREVTRELIVPRVPGLPLHPGAEQFFREVGLID